MEIRNLKRIPADFQEPLRNFVKSQLAFHRDTGSIPIDIVVIDQFVFVLDYDLTNEVVALTSYWRIDKKVAKVFKNE